MSLKFLTTEDCRSVMELCEAQNVHATDDVLHRRVRIVADVAIPKALARMYAEHHVSRSRRPPHWIFCEAVIVRRDETGTTIDCHFTAGTKK